MKDLLVEVVKAVAALVQQLIGALRRSKGKEWVEALQQSREADEAEEWQAVKGSGEE